MSKRRSLGVWQYAFADWLTALTVWLLFYVYRKMQMEGLAFSWSWWNDERLLLGCTLVPLGWLSLYALTGVYSDIYRKARMTELIHTLGATIVGVTVIFFALLLDDFVTYYQAYYKAYFTLFAFHFCLTASVRFITLTRANRRIRKGKVSFNTLLIGCNQRALEMYDEIRSAPHAPGYRFIGYLDPSPEGKGDKVMSEKLPFLGSLAALESILRKEDTEEVIIAVETSQHDRLRSILTILYKYEIRIKLVPDTYDILVGTVHFNEVFGVVLMELRQELMPLWQRVVKRLMDIFAAFIALVLLLPFYGFIAYRVRRSSAGPVLYLQERIGRNGKPFKIIKFRSMYMDAEQLGPQLSRDKDSRCTPWGLVMRKWRLDELPQFWNVLRGDMSLVGPRPERQFFIDQLISQAPHYHYLLRVRPGITSWGQVKFGYASSVEEMLQRMRFDLLYIENMSLALDLKIMIYTVLVLAQGRGK